MVLTVRYGVRLLNLDNLLARWPDHVFSYTLVDLEQQYTPPVVSGSGTNQTLYTYDADCKLTQITRSDGQRVVLNYDSAGRLGSPCPTGSSAIPNDPAMGHLKTLTAPDGGTLTYSYDGSLLTGTTSGKEGQIFTQIHFVNGYLDRYQAEIELSDRDRPPVAQSHSQGVGESD